jgi:hypothetical protein
MYEYRQSTVAETPTNGMQIQTRWVRNINTRNFTEKYAVPLSLSLTKFTKINEKQITPSQLIKKA